LRYPWYIIIIIIRNFCTVISRILLHSLFHALWKPTLPYRRPHWTYNDFLLKDCLLTIWHTLRDVLDSHYSTPGIWNWHVLANIKCFEEMKGLKSKSEQSTVYGKGCRYCHMYECLWMGFGLVARFIECLYTQLVTMSNNNNLTGLHTLNCSTCKVFYVLTSRFLIMDFNSALLCPYWLANHSQLTHCSNCLTPRLEAISCWPSTLLFTEWLTAAPNLSCLQYLSRMAQITLLLVVVQLFLWELYVCEVVTQQRLLYVCLSHCHCPATGLHATILGSCKFSKHSNIGTIEHVRVRNGAS
jgi:hypothetical protein